MVLGPLRWRRWGQESQVISHDSFPLKVATPRDMVGRGPCYGATALNDVGIGNERLRRDAQGEQPGRPLERKRTATSLCLGEFQRVENSAAHRSHATCLPLIIRLKREKQEI